ncbi:hypothetical protein LMH87_006075 [Akanthomyces muscarius]|uniref:Uncharacterized protein n=1 Tax=Akanthomyces muscarius TaxID=2231603 RepID=A0A9W8QMM7_AKAMU|nr:hypothetical protein LMH87_006075 [Akanthomyces muscarius]KAJ4164399.1 hypothetical protein LMH87_006075 [Akanthomyces muscarius]
MWQWRRQYCRTGTRFSPASCLITAPSTYVTAPALSAVLARQVLRQADNVSDPNSSPKTAFISSNEHTNQVLRFRCVHHAQDSRICAGMSFI